MRKFCLEPGSSTREKLAILSQCILAKKEYEFVYSKKALEAHIPIGSVAYCEQIIPKSIRKNFYPDFLSNFLYRKISLNLKNRTKSYFIKDAANWKSDFVSKIYEKDEVLPEGQYLFSDPVSFVQEWRYYIAKGKLITTGWYSGEDENEPAPLLKIEWPIDFNAAVDFGRLSTGEIALVESHDPFACGWYGDNHKDYAFWQYEAWDGFLKSTL